MAAWGAILSAIGKAIGNVAGQSGTNAGVMTSGLGEGLQGMAGLDQGSAQLIDPTMMMQAAEPATQAAKPTLLDALKNQARETAVNTGIGAAIQPGGRGEKKQVLDPNVMMQQMQQLMQQQQAMRR